MGLYDDSTFEREADEALFKKAICVFLIILLLFSTGCSKPVDTNAAVSSKRQKAGYEDKTSLCYIYVQAIEILLEEDTALNQGMKYIAIDMDTLKGISRDNEKEISEYFEKKYTKVKDASLEDLKKEGEFDARNKLLKNGVAVKVNKIMEFTDESIEFEASKYKSGLGAIGMEFKFKKQDNGWKLVDSGLRWIAANDVEIGG